MTRSKIRTSGADGLTLSSTSLTIANGLTLTDGDVTLASGHGLSFAATSDGGTSTPVELLDDYEEGTFTITATAGDVTLSTGSGEYTKIGRMVHCTFIFTFPSNSSSSGAEIAGFPYTCQNGNQYRGGFVIGATNQTGDVHILMSANSTNATIQNRSQVVLACSALSGSLFVGGGAYPTAS
jgi:hypothetical protein